jgi:hypothetical protein
MSLQDTPNNQKDRISVSCIPNSITQKLFKSNAKRFRERHYWAKNGKAADFSAGSHHRNSFWTVHCQQRSRSQSTSLLSRWQRAITSNDAREIEPYYILVLLLGNQQAYKGFQVVKEMIYEWVYSKIRSRIPTEEKTLISFSRFTFVESERSWQWIKFKSTPPECP